MAYDTAGTSTSLVLEQVRLQLMLQVNERNVSSGERSAAGNLLHVLSCTDCIMSGSFPAVTEYINASSF